MKKSNNSMIDGVCAGVAEYFDIEPFWVRVIFLTCGLTWLYIVLMICMDAPDENK